MAFHGYFENTHMEDEKEHQKCVDCILINKENIKDLGTDIIANNVDPTSITTKKCEKDDKNNEFAKFLF